jgi:3-methylcrotonyl-CoA carboxylase alpha subunit
VVHVQGHAGAPSWRRADTLFVRWGSDVHPVNLFDPIAEADADHGHQGSLNAPMNGSIVRVLVSVGEQVEAGTPLIVLEAMKMEHSIRAPHAGIIGAVHCQEGEMVTEGSVLAEMQAP